MYWPRNNVDKSSDNLWICSFLNDLGIEGEKSFDCNPRVIVRPNPTFGRIPVIDKPIKPPTPRTVSILAIFEMISVKLNMLTGSATFIFNGNKDEIKN